MVDGEAQAGGDVYGAIWRLSQAYVPKAGQIHVFNTSTVVSKSADATCPAYQQGGKCGSCRSCWDPAVRNVAYPRH